MPALKKSNTGIPNLYKKLEKRNGRTYYQYKDPLSGRYLGFGFDEKEAKEVASVLNTEAAELLNTTVARLPLSLFTTLNKFLPKYEKIVNRRYDKGDIAKATAQRYISAATMLAKPHGKLPMNQISARHIADLMDTYIEDDKVFMAVSLRSSWVDLFKEAMHSGEVPPGYNPAAATKKPRTKVQRQRLSLENWRAIHECTPPRHKALLLLALVTGQRRADVVNMKFADVWDDHLHVKQLKTGTMIAIPLALRCDAIGVTLKQAIESCKDRFNSEYLIHHYVRAGSAVAGDPLTENSASRIFSAARTAAKINVKPDKTPPTLHEIRSLAERIYREQGIDTKTLLGHSSQVMTDVYNDDREAKWITLALPGD